MKTFIFISLFFVSTIFAQKTYTGVSGDWNDGDNWTPNGVPTDTDDVIINGGGLTVTVTMNSSAKSITISAGTLQLNSGVTFTVFGNVTVNPTGTFYMAVSPSIATLLVYGNYSNVGITDFRDSNIVISGNVFSTAGSLIKLNGNLVAGGDIIGQFDTDGGDGTNQIYATNPNANVNIFPPTVDANVQPGTPVSPSESPALLAAVNTVIYGGSCPFTVSISSQTGCVGGNVTMTVTTTASSPAYQWQVNKNDVNGWTDLSNNAPYSGVTLANLLITNTTLAMNNYHYRANVTSGGCSKFGSYGILTVNNPSITPTFSFATDICSGANIAALPTSSNNGITGVWSPAVNNSITTLYTFTPNPGQCASNAAVTITVNDCPAQQLTFINSYIYTSLVPRAQSYLWEVTTLDSNGIPVGIPQTRVTYLRNLRISELPKFAYNTQYSVRVTSTVNGVLGSFGSPIVVKTPSAYSTILGVCGTTINSKSIYIVSTLVRYTPGYRYTLTNTASPFDVHSITTYLRVFKLNQLPGLISGATYDVQVEVKNLDDTYLPANPTTCSITIPEETGRFDQSSTIAVNSDFNAFSYPNPFTSQFSINVNSINQDRVNIKVFDMVGRMVEQRNVNIFDIENSRIGEYYQSGVYNVIVSQGENTKSLRVIKR